MQTNIILLISILILACNSESEYITYYNTHKSELTTITNTCETLFKTYHFESASLRNQSADIGIRFSVYESDPYKSVGQYYDSKTLKPKTFPGLDPTICDSCTNEEKLRYQTLLDDHKLKELLTNFQKVNPKAIEITAEGIFFALGNALKSNNGEVEGGLFISFDSSKKPANIIKEIEPGVYLYDAVVH